MIYSASSCLITDLYYGYEKGRFDFDFFAEAVVLGKTIFKSSPMRGCGGGGPGKHVSWDFRARPNPERELSEGT